MKSSFHQFRKNIHLLIKLKQIPKIINHLQNKQFRIIADILKMCININIPEYLTLIINGIQPLFQEDNQMSDSQFNILYEIRFFQFFFLSCKKCEKDAIEVSNIIKLISIQDKQYIIVNYFKILLQQIIATINFIKKLNSLYFLQLLNHTLMDVREIILFALSNFFIDGKTFIKIAIEYSLDSSILNILNGSESLKVQKEAIWALSTLLKYSTLEQKELFLENNDVMKIMCEFLNKNYVQLNDEFLIKLLECFIDVLDYGEHVTSNDNTYENNPQWIQIERSQTVMILEQIVLNNNNEIQRMAQNIIEKYSWTNFDAN